MNSALCHRDGHQQVQQATSTLGTLLATQNMKKVPLLLELCSMWWQKDNNKEYKIIKTNKNNARLYLTRQLWLRSFKQTEATRSQPG